MKTTKQTNKSQKIIAVALVLVILTTMLVGCNSKVDDETSTTTTTTNASQSDEGTTIANGDNILESDNQTEFEESSSDVADNEDKSSTTTTKKNTSSGGKETTTKKNTSSGSSNKVTTTTKPKETTTVASCKHSWKLLSYTNGAYVYNCSKCDDYKSEEREMNPNDFMGTKSEYLELLGYVNEARREAGLNELVYIDELQSGANIRAQELTEKFSHTRPNGEHQSTVYANYKFTELHGKLFVSCQENAASGTKTAKATFNAWMNSEGHKKAILNESAYGFVASRCNNKWMMAVICCPSEE